MSQDISYFHSVLKDELDLTQHYVKTFSESKDRLVNKAIKHIVENRGKMLRPIFLILSGRYTYLQSNADKENEVQFVENLTKGAAIVELIQISSLIHDDVLDHSTKRRNKSTLNSLRGNRFAILMGDYLVAQSLQNCFKLVSQAESVIDKEILQFFLESIVKLILGEIQQNNFNENLEVHDDEIKTYFEIIENKTASLFSLACTAGSNIGSNNTEQAQALRMFGHHVGIAYQIIDDLRDYAFSKDIAGEKNFQDLIFGIKTLPLIYASKSLDKEGQEILTNFFNCKREISEKNKFEIIDILEKSDSIDKCLGEAKANLLKARVILNNLPENKYSLLLIDMLDYISKIGDSIVDDIRSIRILK